MRPILCDSRDRVSGTLADFTIQLPEMLVFQSGHRGRIDFLRLPICVPTIHRGVNDTIVVSYGAQVRTVTIVQGQYTGIELAAAIQQQFTSVLAGATWTVTYDNSNVAMTIMSTVSFEIIGGTLGAQLLSRPHTKMLALFLSVPMWNYMCGAQKHTNRSMARVSPCPEET